MAGAAVASRGGPCGPRVWRGHGDLAVHPLCPRRWAL